MSSHGVGHRSTDNGSGVYVLVAIVVVAATLVASLVTARVPGTISNFAAGITARPPYVPAPDPIAAAEAGLPPSSTAHPLPLSSSIRAIELTPDSVYLVAAGRSVRTIEGRASTLQALLPLVDDRTWLSEPRPGHFVLGAALVIGSDVVFAIGSPTRVVTMEDRVGVFIGVQRGSLSIDGVTVTSQARPPNPRSPYRPFVTADFGSTMTLVDSQFLDLGYDWNASYGVSWMDRSTGEAVGSTFNGGFIGLYTDHVVGLTIRSDVFEGNALYGLDPHSYSRGLLIDGDTFSQNARHGLILANHVSDSVIDDVVASDNGQNGIMLDASSDGDVVEHSTAVGNHGDGIVLSGSVGDRIADDVVRSNRVGIEAVGVGAGREQIHDNRIVENRLAVQGLPVGSNELSENGGQWRWSGATIALAVGAAVLVALELLTAMLRRRQLSRRS
jgi:mannuronan 5-epimerase